MAAPFLALQCPSWPPWERVVTRQLRKQSWASLFVGDTFQNAIPPTTNRNYRIHLTEENLLPFTLKQKPDTRRFPAPPSPRQWDFCLHGRRTGLPHRSRALQCLFTNNLVRSETGNSCLHCSSFHLLTTQSPFTKLSVPFSHSRGGERAMALLPLNTFFKERLSCFSYNPHAEEASDSPNWV